MAETYTTPFIREDKEHLSINMAAPYCDLEKMVRGQALYHPFHPNLELQGKKAALSVNTALPAPESWYKLYAVNTPGSGWWSPHIFLSQANPMLFL